MIEKLLREGVSGGLTGPPDISEAARARRLLDVAYAYEESPVGRLLLAATPRGLLTVSYGDRLEELAARISPRVLHAPARLDPVRRELEEFFAGRRRSFDLALDLSLSAGFGRSVLRAAVQIPFGEISTYGRIAAAAGSPRAYRAAGTALGRNPLPIVIPCHRVLPAGGGIGQYTGGTWRKQVLLELEGVSGG